MHSFQVWSQDISKDYHDSAEELMRDLFIKPTKESGLSRNALLKLSKSYTDFPENGDNWHSTFANHLRRTSEWPLGYLILLLLYQSKSPASWAHWFIRRWQNICRLSIFDRCTKITKSKFQSKPRFYDLFYFSGGETEAIGQHSFRTHQAGFAKCTATLPLDCTCISQAQWTRFSRWQKARFWFWCRMA